MEPVAVMNNFNVIGKGVRVFRLSDNQEYIVLASKINEVRMVNLDNGNVETIPTSVFNEYFKSSICYNPDKIGEL